MKAASWDSEDGKVFYYCSTEEIGASWNRPADPVST